LGTDVSGGYAPSILKTIQDTSAAARSLSFQRECHSPESPDPASKSHHSDGHNHDHHNHDNHHHDHHHNHQFTNRPFSIATLLYLATAGGAAVCNIQEQVGSFEVGKSFDALLVNVGEESWNPGLWGLDGLATCRGTAAVDVDIGLEERKNKLEKERKIMEDWLERFLLGGDDRNIEKVYVQGRFVGGRTFRT
jgi:guanine deaminase